MKTSVMSSDVQSMLELRHGAEQRGNFEPLGRLQWLQTEHGVIRFPVLNTATGEGCGPDLAWTDTEGAVNLHKNSAPPGWALAFLVLGAWAGLPPLRINTSKPCPKCRHACDVCDGSGKKLCELCGGRSWIPGNWLPCPGPGCLKDSGQYKADCATCLTSEVRGQIREQQACKMCEGTKQMTCSRCLGTGKYSTGRMNGAVDWDVSPKCKACDGTTYVGEWQRQDERKFMNAALTIPRTAHKSAKGFLVLGPIHSFAITDYQSSRTRVFTVTPDATKDFLVLLVPRSRRQTPQKAYLVGGVVREREFMKAVGM